MTSSSTGNDVFAKLYEQHFHTVWHICLSYMKNRADAEDALQETFLRYLKCGKVFTPKNGLSAEEQQKAWLIVTAGNVCKNQLKSWQRKQEPLDTYEATLCQEAYEVDTTLSAVMELPDKYKIPVYLYYYVGYDSAQIAALLHKPKSTIRNYLSEARKQLRKVLGEP